MHLPLITAHSGCDGTPDNTMEYVLFALKSGAGALEIDVHTRSDGALVMAHDHDPTLVYKNCPEIQKVFDLLTRHPSVAINCDLKEPGLEIPVYQLAQRYPSLSGRLIFSGTVSPKLLREHPEILDFAEVFLNIEENIENFYENMQTVPDFDVTAAQKTVKLCNSCGIKTVNINYNACTPALAETLSKNKIGISVWTVNDAQDIKKFIDLAVHNITTRRVSIALSVLPQ